VHVEVVTLFPELVAAVGEHGIPRRAIERGLLSLGTQNPRDFTGDPHRTVDDRPYGGGPGMVMKVEPLRAAIAAARAATGNARVIYMSPQGRPLDQQRVRELAEKPGLVLVAGRYEGIDERVIEMEIDEEISLGDYVLSGGELPAMVLIDALARLQPGALGHAESAAQDSFEDDGLLDCPHYTRPETLEGRQVPAVLLSGNHAVIARWRRQQMLGRTAERRPELLDEDALGEPDRKLLADYRAASQCRDA
jgi:tRNA (guanine37-N1)-methyltransferase